MYSPSYQKLGHFVLVLPHTTRAYASVAFACSLCFSISARADAALMPCGKIAIAYQMSITGQDDCRLSVNKTCDSVRRLQNTLSMWKALSPMSCVSVYWANMNLFKHFCRGSFIAKASESAVSQSSALGYWPKRVHRTEGGLWKCECWFQHEMRVTNWQACPAWAFMARGLHDQEEQRAKLACRFLIHKGVSELV